MGLYIIVGRFFVDSLRRAHADYGVTDQRVIIVDGLFGRRVKSLALEGVADMSLSERPDGSGTITFGSGTGPSSWPGGSSWPGMRNRQPPSFEMIPGVRQVYSLIREAQQSNRGRRVA
nr:PH domain-containing protein [Rhodanobacter sp. DHB23]